MKQNFGDHVSVATITEPEPAVAHEDEKPEETERKEFEFHLLPRDIKAHLDRFVIKQEEAKKVLAIAVCDHYNHANTFDGSRKRIRIGLRKLNTSSKT